MGKAMSGLKGDAGIGRRVRASRARLGWTREELAVRSGMSWSAIAQVESGRRANPRPGTLSAIARALGVSIDYLVDGAPVATPMLEHRALIYGSDEDFATTTSEFLREGIERSEPGLAVTTERNVALIRGRLGSDADRVRLEDSAAWLRTPEAAVDSFQEFIGTQLDRGADWVRIIGEPLWPGRSEDEVRQWTRFESIVNLAFASAPLSFLCPYDERTLAPTVVEQAHHTHPQVVTAGGVAKSSSYRDPLGFALDD